MLTEPGCRARQKRLLEWMVKEQWDVFLTSDYRTVYYFSGLLGAKEFPTLFVQGLGWSNESHRQFPGFRLLR